MTFGLSLAGEPVDLDVETLIGSHLAIMANSGAGKSRTIRKLLELAAGHAQRIVLDVEDEFYTLREASPELVIAGGDNGDCPATVKNAADLARFLLETGVDAVVQINDLGLDGQRDFIAVFLDAMIGAPKNLWHPALVVLDETHRYAPQDGNATSLPAVVSLMAQGRKRGFTGVVATQRLAKINKDATGDINNWLMGRVGQATDRRVVADALGFRATGVEAQDLQKLPAGRFWGFGPAISPVPVLIHVGDVATTHLRSGQRNVPTPPAPDAIREMMAGLVQAAVEPPLAPVSTGSDWDQAYAAGHAAATADFMTSDSTPSNDTTKSYEAEAERLRTRVADLEQIVAIIERGWAKAKLHNEILAEQMNKIAEIAAHDGHTIIGAERVYVTDIPSAAGGQAETVKTTPTSADPIPQPAPLAAAGRVQPVQARILDALAELEAIGAKQPPRVLVAILAGYGNVTSKGFANAIGALRTGGLISYPATGLVALTDDGRDKATATPKPLSSAALQARVMAFLDGPGRTILGALIGAYPKSMEREALGAAAGYSNLTSKGFANALGRLRTLGFIDYPERGKVAALPILFIERPAR